MENHSLSFASGWQTLSSILGADTTFSGKYLWSWLYIKDTHATQTIIVKTLPGATAPASDSGINLAAAGSIIINPGEGVIDGKAIWIKASGNTTTVDISFIRKPGIN